MTSILSLCTHLCLSQDSWQHYPDIPQPLSIATGADGVVWLATEEGAYHYNEGTWTHYNTENGLPDNDLSSVFIDNQEQVWVGGLASGTSGFGASMFNGASWSTLTTADGLAGGHVLGFGQEGNNMWFGAYGGGVSQLDDSGGWTNYTSTSTSGALTNDLIRRLLVHPNGDKWFITIPPRRPLFSL